MTAGSPLPSDPGADPVVDDDVRATSPIPTDADDTVVTRPVDDDAMTRSEERVHVDVEDAVAGAVHVRKRIETEHVRTPVNVGVEDADLERETVVEGDSGEILTLPDGSVSIPVFEEVLVVEKRRVVRERVILRKRTTYEERTVEAELRREVIEVDVDDSVRDRVTGA